MALDKIIIGCTWTALIGPIGPSAGRTTADVTADLTGATAACSLYSPGLVRLVDLACVIDPTDRLIEITLSAALSAGLSPTLPATSLVPISGALLDLRITAADGRVLPLAVQERVGIARLTSP